MLDLIVLGLVQGLTEFLPVSSTAHLLFVQHFLGIPRPGLVLEGVLHLGTAAAAAVLFWPDVRRLVTALPTLVRPRAPTVGDHRLMVAVLVATVVTGVAGLVFADLFERLYASVRGTAYQLLVTGGLLMLARRDGRRTADHASVRDGIVIGLAQALSIVPGISRSAATIVAGMALGMQRTEAARFSFLVAIPAVAGAGLFALKDAGAAQGLGFTPWALAAGAIVAGASGAAAILWLLEVVRRGRLVWFAAYCWVVAVVVLAATRG